MRSRIQGMLLGILFGLLGAWMSLVGAGVLKTRLGGLEGPAQVVGGLMFFFAGAWSFFQSTLGPGGQDLPVYPWIQYFMILPILAGFGLIMFLSGAETGETSLFLLGILPLLGTLWYAIAKFPGRRKKQ
jgi:cytochrome bd-type quinol oxidase subunit 2